MNLKILLSLLSLVIFINNGTLSAQTCKISAKDYYTGCESYIEVFEYDYVDEKPEFPGGGQSLLNYINEQRNYPEDAYNNGIQGRVKCSFVVNTDGKLSNLTLLRGVEASLNAEAMRIISSMPAWKPGKLNGVTVPVRVICCVPFRK